MIKNDYSNRIMIKSACVGLFLAILYLAVIRPFGILETPIFRAQDLFFKIRSQMVKPPSVLDQIVLIVIDDESIEKQNQKWPFERKVFADLLNRITEAKPRVTAFDFVFSGKSNPIDDFLLSRALANAGPTVLASFVDTNGNYILPYHEFLSAATAVGIINKVQDRDLGVRRVNVTYLDTYGRSVGRPWELEIAKAAYNMNENALQKSHKKVPVNYRFNFKQVHSIPYWKLIKNWSLISEFSGQIVVIATTSKVLHDYYHTPLGLLPGVVINLNLLVSILSNDFLKQLPVLIPAFFLLLFSFGGIYLSLQLGVLTSLSTLAGASALFLIFSFSLFLNNYLLDYFTPLLLGWLCFVSVSFYRYFFTLLENIQLRTKVAIDPLTGLYNRRFLETNINQALEQSDHHELSVLMIDIDNFKKINDTYGHQFGDDVIKNVSFVIKEELREGDSAVRYGGEEFCVILPKTSKKDGAQIGERIRQKIEEHKFSYVNQVAQFTVSVGVAATKTDQLLANRSLIRAADRALYHAKKTGKNKVSLYQND